MVRLALEQLLGSKRGLRGTLLGQSLPAQRSFGPRPLPFPLTHRPRHYGHPAGAAAQVAFRLDRHIERAVDSQRE